MLYIILYCFAKLERQLQVRPELTNSIRSFQCRPDFLMQQVKTLVRTVQIQKWYKYDPSVSIKTWLRFLRREFI
jgi:hypothetical protein